LAIFLPDTSCIIARIAVWHEHHRSARAEIEQRLGRGDEMILAAHSLIESYATLTSFPPTQRVSPSEALSALRESFVGRWRVVALEPADYAFLLDDARRRAITGGSIYDAAIAACARKGGATTLLTFNARHFTPLAGPDLEIVVPS